MYINSVAVIFSNYLIVCGSFSIDLWFHMFKNHFIGKDFTFFYSMCIFITYLYQLVS